MPLPEPTSPRQHLHTRSIECAGYLREDGLWDIEAHLRDTKAYPFENAWRGTMHPGDPVHDMWLRLTMDDDFTIHEAEAVMDGHPFPICPGATPNYKRLVGERIGAGWNRRVRELLGGTDGCTHLREMAGTLATVAFQTIRPYKRHETQQRLEPGQQDPTTKRPAQLNSCYAYDSRREVVQQWMPEFYTGPEQ